MQAKHKDNLAQKQKWTDECTVKMGPFFLIKAALDKLFLGFFTAGREKFLFSDEVLSSHFHFPTGNYNSILAKHSELHCGMLYNLVQERVRTFTPACGCRTRRLRLLVSLNKIFLMLIIRNTSIQSHHLLLALLFTRAHSMFLFVIFKVKSISPDGYIDR